MNINFKSSGDQNLCPIISNVNQWRLMKLVEKTVKIDVMDYPRLPVDQILGMLVWMAR
jgi:hypothetical protein